MITPRGLPADQYHCLLDEQPYYLVPPRLFRPDEHGALIVNPSCWFSWQGSPPKHIAARIHHAKFLSSPLVVWVDDAATGAVWPYWIGHEYISYLAPAVAGQKLPNSIPASVQWVLSRAEILVTRDHARQRRQEWSAMLGARIGYFRPGYVALGNLLPPFHLGALRRYYRSLIHLNSLTLGDSQVQRRFVAHNEPVAGYIHRELVHGVSGIAGTRLKPSYSYVAAYQSGAELHRHTDREQCDYSVTLCLDATPEPLEQSPWPIYLDTSEGTVGVWQYLGEGLFYRGRQLPHYRHRLATGHTMTSLLLHYVDDGFTGSLN